VTVPTPRVEPGAYQHDGQIYTVQWNRAHTYVYAKQLVEIGGERLRVADGAHVNIDFEYAPGMVARLRPDERMTWEQARPFVIRYGMCLFGHPLRDATSVELGIGPVCRRMFPDLVNPSAPVVRPDPAVSAALAALLPGRSS